MGEYSSEGVLNRMLSEQVKEGLAAPLLLGSANKRVK